MGIIRIAIDGPSGSGKSTTAKSIAKALKIEYVDTGAMYRAVAYKARANGILPEDDDAVKQMLEHTEIDFIDGNVYLDGQNVNDKIRTIEISALASLISKLPSCRSKLVDIQRSIANAKSVVMDGRDIGTNVLEDAEFKFYITASADVRIRRRFEELKAKGDDVTIEAVAADLMQRDLNDTMRELNPLRKADDAIEISTDEKNIEQVTKTLLQYINSKG